MDWIKIKSKHLMNNGFTLLETGAIVRLQILTAFLERIPTDSEMRAQVPDRLREAVARRLQGQRTTLGEVLHKVCEDVAEVLHKRSEATARKQKQRNVTRDTPRIDKIREDKIREEEIDIAGNREFKPPTLKDVSDYFQIIGSIADPELYFNHYESNGWKVGPNKMNDWKPSVRNWAKREVEKQSEKNLKGKPAKLSDAEFQKRVDEITERLG
jgi:hypothetical protein